MHPALSQDFIAHHMHTNEYIDCVMKPNSIPNNYVARLWYYFARVVALPILTPVSNNMLVDHCFVVIFDL